MRNISAKMGQDLGIFYALVGSAPKDVNELQQATDVQPPFLGKRTPLLNPSH